ncbi:MULTISPECIES: pyocin activator PrtN family protein [Pseudomonadota]|uniref:pyocin activator PrtN family protein n=1 Tax=Pseudomonadota TaxID=1224 RepID=UPI0022FE902F|nr:MULTISPECIES: pyocin activator PrtN family protein [unclassified Cobetia]MDA5564314.1 pyocin activator PrtN family protein [Cobetia sp. MMG027]MDH2290034.1 pyocin activator PrtN family protein [Cobetia sp. 10Alg 146]
MKTEFALLALYETVTLPLPKVAEDILGIALSTARNQISQGTFPIKVTRINGKPMVHITDVAEYIDKQRAEAAA